MEDFNPTDFAKIRARAEALYHSVIKAHCPALAADIHFSSDGFHHLRFNGARVKRTKFVQKTKMLCLQEAVDVINQCRRAADRRWQLSLLERHAFLEGGQN